MKTVKLLHRLFAPIVKGFLKIQEFFGKTSQLSESEINTLGEMFAVFTEAERMAFVNDDNIDEARFTGRSCLCAIAVGRASFRDFDEYLGHLETFLEIAPSAREFEPMNLYKSLYSTAVFTGNCQLETQLRQRFFVDEPYISAASFQLLLVDSEAFKEPLSAIGEARLTMLRELLIQLPEVRSLFKQLICLLRDSRINDGTLSAAERRAGERTLPKLFNSFTDTDIRRAFEDPKFVSDVWIFSRQSEDQYALTLASLYGKEKSSRHESVFEALVETVENGTPLTGVELKRFLDAQEVPVPQQRRYLLSDACRLSTQAGFITEFTQLDALLTTRDEFQNSRFQKL